MTIRRLNTFIQEKEFRITGELISFILIVCFSGFLTDILINESKIRFSGQETSILLPYLLKGGPILWISLVLSFLLIGYSYLVPRKELIAPEINILYRIGTVVLIWTFAFYDFNFFFNSYHLADRLLVLGLGILSLFNPFWLFLFILLTIGVSKQFYLNGLFYYTFTDKKIVFDLLIFFLLYYFLLVRGILKNWCYFFVGVVAIIFHWYSLAGFGKLIGDWVSENNIYYLAYASRIYGWLHFLDEPFLKSSMEFFYNWNDLLEVSAIVVELLLVLLFFMNVRLNRVIIVSCIILHAAIFLLSGIFFWKWIVVLGVLLLISIRYKNSHINDISPFNYAVYVSLLVILPFAHRTVKLSWYDAGFISKYTVMVECDKNLYQLDAAFFSPYDISFSQNRFNFLEKDPTVCGTYGTTNSLQIKNLCYGSDLTNSETYKELLRHGEVKYNKAKVVQFYNFINVFYNNKKLSGFKLTEWLCPPRHIWQGPRGGGGIPPYVNCAEEKIGLLTEKIQLKPNLQFNIVNSDTLLIRNDL